MISKPQGLGAFPLFAYQHHYIVLFLFMIVAIASGFLAKNLTLNADLSALLPDTFESVQDLNEVKTFFGGIGYVVVTAQGGKPQALRNFADDVAKTVSPLENIKFVDFRRPVNFFQDRALYFLDTDDLNTIRKRIKKRWKWEKNKRNPMYIDLENAPAPSLNFEDLQNKYNSGGKSSWMSAQQSNEAYYFNQDRSLIAIFIKPNLPSSDLDFTQQLLKDIRQKISLLDLKSYAENLKVEFTGRYQKKIDLQKQMQSDLATASLVAFLLVIAYLMLHFRRIEAVILILLPLIVGIIFTFAFAAMVYGSLNILTAFIGVILLGLGIDHGIHLISRYQDERKKGLDESVVIFNTFTQTGRAVTIAAFTTLIIFVGLGFSEFRAFHEFGVIAAAGMILIVISYLLCLPPLLKLTSQTTWKPRNISFGRKLSTQTPTQTSAKTKGETEEKETHETAGPRATNGHQFSFFSKRWQVIILTVSTLCILLLTLNIGNLRFNYDFESLGNANLRSFQLDREVNKLLGYSQTPMVALSDDEQQQRYVTDLFRNTQETLQNKSGIDFLLSSSDLVPINQEEKQRIIKKIKKIIKKVKDSWLEEDDLKQLNEFKRMVKSAPFNYSELPLEIRQLFGTNNNQHSQHASLSSSQPSSQPSSQKGVIMLFPSISLSDGKRVLDLAKEIRSVKQSDGQRLPVAGESMILADILNLVFKESPRVLIISTILIVLFMWFFMRKFTYTIMCLLPAVLTISLTLGVMALLNIELNYINMLMIPILLGIGVDSGIHMVSRAIDGDSLGQILNETGLAIFGSIFTSGLGIGALLLTNHSGLNSLAHVAIIGLGVNLLVSLLLLPTLLNLKPIQHQLKN